MDKALLEAPEYEDRTQIVLRQLIRLGEANERNAVSHLIWGFKFIKPRHSSLISFTSVDFRRAKRLQL